MKNYKICKNCDYSFNRLHSSNCEICGEALNQKKTEQIKVNSKPKLTIKLKSIKNSLFVVIFLALSGVTAFYSFSNSTFSKTNATTNTAKNATSKLPDGLFLYWGPPCSVRLISQNIANEIKDNYPNFRLRLTDYHENKDPIEELLDDQLFLVLSEKPFLDKYNEKAKEKGVKLVGTPFALDGIAYITNKDNKNISLNIQQLQDIYEGKITNWNQVGGEDKKITPILLSGLGRNTLFLSLTQLNPNTKYIEDRAEGMSLVEQEEGAIFYTSASLAATEQNVNIISLQNKDNQIVSPVIDGQPNQEAFENGSYPQTRVMYAIHKEAMQNQVQDMVHSFVNYLTSPQQGQSIVQESGFVPLYR